MAERHLSETEKLLRKIDMITTALKGKHDENGTV